MEIAQTLDTRIAIVDRGRLQAVGTTEQSVIEERFGLVAALANDHGNRHGRRLRDDVFGRGLVSGWGCSSGPRRLGTLGIVSSVL